MPSAARACSQQKNHEPRRPQLLGAPRTLGPPSSRRPGLPLNCARGNSRSRHKPGPGLRLRVWLPLCCPNEHPSMPSKPAARSKVDVAANRAVIAGPTAVVVPAFSIESRSVAGIGPTLIADRSIPKDRRRAADEPPHHRSRSRTIRSHVRRFRNIYPHVLSGNVDRPASLNDRRLLRTVIGAGPEALCHTTSVLATDCGIARVIRMHGNAAVDPNLTIISWSVQVRAPGLADQALGLGAAEMSGCDGEDGASPG
jgi:hypothetical protein